MWCIGGSPWLKFWDFRSTISQVQSLGGTEISVQEAKKKEERLSHFSHVRFSHSLDDDTTRFSVHGIPSDKNAGGFFLTRRSNLICLCLLLQARFFTYIQEGLTVEMFVKETPLDGFILLKIKRRELAHRIQKFHIGKKK